MNPTPIDPENITVSKYNERKEEIIDDEKLESLKDSIEEVGVVQPVIVREIGEDEYDVVIGQRRVTAAQAIGLANIPAVVMDWNGEEAIVASISENVESFSQSVSTSDRADALAQLWEEMDYEGRPQASKLSERIGVNRSTVTRWLEPLREEWEGTEVDPVGEDDDEDDDDEESDEDDIPHTDQSLAEGIDDSEGLHDDQIDEERDNADESAESGSIPNTEALPDDANEFDDDPIDQVGDIDAGEKREAEEDDGEDYDGPDPYTDGAESKPALQNEDGEEPNTHQDPEEANTEEYEPEQEADDMGLDPELADMSTEKISVARRITGGGDEGVETLRKFKDNDLSVHQVREVGKRVDNGADISDAVEGVVKSDNEEGPRVSISFTLTGDDVDAVEALAEEKSTSVNEIAKEKLVNALDEDDSE